MKELFSGELRLDEARERFSNHVEDGLTCPLCTQFAKVYKFKINASQAVAAIRIWRAGGTNWVNVSALELPHTLHAHLSKLRFWGIIEKPEGLIRDDGSPRIGIWRVTRFGEEWVGGRTTVPSHARIYDNECLGLTGDPTSVKDALGHKFNYADLMSI